MGFDIASAANLGASVILVAGPTHLTVSPLVQVTQFTAQEMYEACHQYFDDGR
jgi:phosphopantothenoylcysteine decarboxylase/phosphopantothenate--cysteine ligase